MTGQDWGSEGAGLWPGKSKGANAHYGPCKGGSSAGEQSPEGFVHDCVCACILPPPAQIYTGLQPVNLGELEDSLKVWTLSFRSGFVEWREFTSWRLIGCFTLWMIGNAAHLQKKKTKQVLLLFKCICIFRDHVASDQALENWFKEISLTPACQMEHSLNPLVLSHASN